MPYGISTEKTGIATFMSKICGERIRLTGPLHKAGTPVNTGKEIHDEKRVGSWRVRAIVSELFSNAKEVVLHQQKREKTLKNEFVSVCLARLAFVVVSLLTQGGCAVQNGAVSLPMTAEDLLNRPNRIAEEQAAWNPKPMPMEEFLNSPVPFKEKYPVTELDKYVVATYWYWMDNRYVMTSASDKKDPETGFNIPNVSILDTDTNTVYQHKKGRFFCYKNNNIAYETHELDKSSRKRLYGKLGRENEVPIFHLVSGKRVEYLIDDFFDCKNTRGYEEYQEIAKAKFGEKATGQPKQTFAPLLPGHGFFSWETYDIPKADSEWRNRDKRIGLDWHSSTDHKKWLELSLSYEVDNEIKPNFWSAFLGRYIFNQNAGFNRSRLGAHRILNDFDVQYSLYVVTFSPLDGSVTKVHKPEAVLDNVSTTGIFATRAGFLWTGDIATPGLYLSQGEKLKHILDELVYPRDVHISPDGCKVKVHAYPNRRATATGGSFRGVLGAVIAHSAPNPSNWDKSRHLLINLCKGA